MSLEISTGSFSSSLAPQTDFYHVNRADPPVSRGDPSTSKDAVDLSVKLFNQDLRFTMAPETKKDTVDLSSRQFNRELKFVMDPETKKVVAKVIDQKTHEVIRQIPDKGPEPVSNIAGYMGKTVSVAV